MVSLSAESEDAVKKITFEDHIKPIFREKCLNCHNQGEAKGGLALDSYAATMEGGGGGEIVYDGDAEGSRLWQLVAHEDTPVMPPDQPRIPDEQVNLIRDWITGGLLENSGSKVSKKKTNLMAASGSVSGKPEGEAAMPESMVMQPALATSRAFAVTAMAASPWAPVIAIGGQRQVVFYHTESGDFLGVVPFPEGSIHSLRFSRDGSYLIAGGGADAALGVVAIYDVRTGDRMATVGDELDTVLGADVNESMSRIALGGPQKMLRIYDVADGELLHDIKKHTDWILDVAYSPDGVLLASSDRSAGLIVWEADTGRQYLNLTEHKDAINALAWRDDSNVLASASDDGTVKLWEVNEGKVLRSINAHSGGVTSVAFDHQGQLITAGKDKKVKLWDASGSQKVEFPALSDWALQAAISHDSKQAFGGDWAGFVAAWSVENPKDSATQLPANPPLLQERIATALQEVKSTQGPLDVALKRLDELKAERGAIVTRKNDLRAQQELLQKQIDQQAGEVGGMEKKVAAEMESRNDLRRKVEQKHAEIGKLIKDGQEEGKVVEAEEGLVRVLQQLVSKRKQVVALSQSVASMSSAREKSKKEYDSLAAAVAAEEGKLVEKEQSLAEQEKAVTAAKSVNADAVKEQERWQNALLQFEERLERLTSIDVQADADDEDAQRLIDQAVLFKTVYSD